LPDAGGEESQEISCLAMTGAKVLRSEMKILRDFITLLEMTLSLF
jgi:hypothetical protein